MYKNGAHYPLADVQRAFVEGRYDLSNSAREYMSMEEMTREELVECVCAMRRNNCSQSMTHNSDNKVWIDSYVFKRSDGAKWYLKVHPSFADPDNRFFLMRLHPSDGE